jgi:Uma2 family endonuclease
VVRAGVGQDESVEVPWPVVHAAFETGASTHEPKERAMAVSAETYRRLVAEDSNATWELVDGRLREKPAMSFQHNDVSALLGYSLMTRLDLALFRVHFNGTRLERNDRNYFVPDIAVIPAELFIPIRTRMNALDFYAQPLPLVVEVWSPPAPTYDVDEKIPQYKARGDREIWRIHPYEKTLTIWRQQPDGSYVESFHRNETVYPASLSNVAIELPSLFI